MFSVGYILKRVQTPTYFNLILQGHKVMQFGEWVRIAILLIQIIESMVLYEGEKNLSSDACQVYRVYSTFFTLYSLLHPPFLSFFSLLSLSTHYSDSLGYCVLLVLRCLMIVVVLFPYSWILFLLYPRSILGDFPFLPLLSSTILSAASVQPIPTTYRSGRVQVDSLHYLLAARSGPTTYLVTNFFPLLGKSQSSHDTIISLFLLTTNPRKSLLSSLPNMHQIVPTNFLPILVSGHT